jgi:hypothetical protein
LDFLFGNFLGGLFGKVGPPASVTRSPCYSKDKDTLSYSLTAIHREGEKPRAMQASTGTYASDFSKKPSKEIPKKENPKISSKKTARQTKKRL